MWKWLAIGIAVGVGYLVLKGRTLVRMTSAEASSVVNRGIIPQRYLDEGYIFYWTSENGVTEPYSRRVPVQNGIIWEDEPRVVVPISMR